MMREYDQYLYIVAVLRILHLCDWTGSDYFLFYHKELSLDQLYDEYNNPDERTIERYKSF